MVDKAFLVGVDDLQQMCKEPHDFLATQSSVLGLKFDCLFADVSYAALGDYF